MRAILSDLALAWHEQLKWPTDWVESLSQLDSWLPKMRRDLADGRTLVVLDGLHSMLSRSAHWKDPRFAQLVKALCDHSGDSRAILTSRLIPVDIPDGILRREVGQLPRADLVLRLQASPRLRTLVGEVEVDRSGDVVGAFSPAAEDLIALLEVRPQLIEPLVADTVDVPKVREFASTLKLTEHERNALDIALRPVSSDHASVADRG